LEKGHSYTVRALAQLGANVNTANAGGWTPIMMAAARGDLETMTILLEHEADVTPRNKWGATALSEAQQSMRAKKAVTLLRQAGAEE
jgi:uncharacterized protein